MKTKFLTALITVALLLCAGIAVAIPTAEDPLVGASEPNQMLDNPAFLTHAAQNDIASGAVFGSDLIVNNTSNSSLIVNRTSDVLIIVNQTLGGHLIDRTISIVGNSELIAQAARRSWTGNGTESNPYVIAGLKFNGTDDCPVELAMTSLYVEIRNCTFIDNYVGIILAKSVSNVTVCNNTFIGGYQSIEVFDAINVTVSDNMFDGGILGIYIVGSQNITVRNNAMNGMYDYGMLIEDSDGCIISQNLIAGSEVWGICLINSDENVICDNVITGTPLPIQLEYYGYDNVISGNTLRDCDPDFEGVSILDTPNNNTVYGNTIIFANEDTDGNMMILGSAIVVLVVLLAAALLVIRKKK